MGHATGECKVVVSKWEAAVDRLLANQLITFEEEERLVAVKDQFAFSQQQLDRHGTYTKLVKAGALREVTEGKMPERVTLNGTLPVNLLHGEKVAWVFPDCNYLEDKNQRKYVGGSEGVSLRVMKVCITHQLLHGRHIDEAVRRKSIQEYWSANLSLYFVGPLKSLRIPYAIVTFVPFREASLWCGTP
jgi:hypothetical protein